MKPMSTRTCPRRRPPTDAPDRFAAVGLGAGAYLLPLAGLPAVGLAGCLPAVGLAGAGCLAAPGLAGGCGLAGAGLPGLALPCGVAAGLPGGVPAGLLGGPLGFFGCSCGVA